MVKIELYGWQKEALKRFVNAGFKGTIEGATGSGKSIIGIASLFIFDERPSTLIIVPTISIMSMWYDKLLQFGCPKEMIGRLGNGFKEVEKKYVIGVIDSVRENSIVKDFFIIDECHHIVSSENCKILDRDFKYVLGLSATVERDDGRHYLLYKKAPLLMRYSIGDGINDGVLSKFVLINQAVSFVSEEVERYEKIDSFIREWWPEYGSFRAVQDWSGRFINFENELQVKKKRVAVELLKKVQERKKLLGNAYNKIGECVKIIKKEGVPKTLVFCEFVETAENIVLRLREEGISCGIYHSGLKKKERQNFIQDYENDVFRVMVSVRCLDEGIDVPNTELGVIVAGSSVNRQIIQRLGRLLRRFYNKKAKLYQVFIPNTKDQDWLKKRNGVLYKFAENVKWRG